MKGGTYTRTNKQTLGCTYIQTDKGTNLQDGIVHVQCESFINELNIINPFDVWMSENEWKRMVKIAVSEANSKEIKGENTVKYKN